MPRGIASNGQRARRRTKAEMQAERAQTPSPTIETPGKRHRRTNAEMQAWREGLNNPPAPPPPQKPTEAPMAVTRAVMATPSRKHHDRPVAPENEREKAGRALHATSLLSFLPWVELSRASREEFCVEAEKNS
jgi:hypothetical protein